MKQSKLFDIISDKSRIITESIDASYLSDTLGRRKGIAEAVLRPISTEEVSDILSFAHENQIQVTPRGAGTNLVGSTVPDQGGIVLDLSLMNHILELDDETFTVTVEAGVVLQELQAYVEERGLFYPPDPGEKLSTIGGNISTNAGGMRAVKYGVTRDYVMGLELVLADGSIVNAGSKNIKDSSGLSIKNLVIGSEGTLAVVTKCILKLLPKPEISKSAVVPFDCLDAGIENVRYIIKENVNPTAIEFVERKVIELGEEFLHVKFPYPNASAYLILTFDGKREEVDENIRQVKSLLLENNALDFILLEEEMLSDVWNLRGSLVKAVESVSEQEPVDIVVPINKTAEFISYVNQLEKESGMQMVSFGHAGDGNVHLCVVRGDRTKAEWEEQKHKNMELLYKKAYSLGGLTSGEHGIGLSKKTYFLNETNPNYLALMRRVKAAFDDKNILNSHKSYNN